MNIDTLIGDTLKYFGLTCNVENVKLGAAFFAGGAISSYAIGKIVKTVTIAGTASYFTLYFLYKYKFISIDWKKVNESNSLISKLKGQLKGALDSNGILLRLSAFMNNPDNVIYVLSSLGGVLFGMLFM